MIEDPFASATVDIGIASTSVLRLFCFGFSVVVIGLLQTFLNHTRLGVAIQATSQNRFAAQLMGINIDFVYMLTFAVGTALAGIGGVLYGTLFAVHPLMEPCRP